MFSFRNLGILFLRPFRTFLLTTRKFDSWIVLDNLRLLTSYSAVNAARPAFVPGPNEGGDTREFILHQSEIKIFCQSLMGTFKALTEILLGPRSTHTLILHCPPSYAQHECKVVNEMQKQVLQQYRGILRGFQDLSIRGTSTGWESGLYSATLRDLRSADARRGLAEFVDGYINDLSALEREGFDALSQTGDYEAAEQSWFKAIVMCRKARNISDGSFMRTLSPCFERTRLASDIQNWAQLRRVQGNEFAVPIINFWYRLLAILVSELLRFIRRGGHLANRHGRGPVLHSRWATTVHEIWSMSLNVKSYFRVTDWLPEPSEEIQICFAVAAVLRLVDDQAGCSVAIDAMTRAIEISPNDEAVDQEAFCVNEWAGRVLRRPGALFIPGLRLERR